jgi:hypothetical protein
VKRKERGSKKLFYFFLRREKGKFLAIYFVMFRLEAKREDLKVKQEQNKAK